MSYEITPELVERFRNAAEQGKGVRLDQGAAYVLFRTLERAIDLRGKPESLDREADAAAYILTGQFPGLSARLGRVAADVAAVDETPDNR